MAVTLISFFLSERFSLQPINSTVSGFVKNTFEGIGDKSFRVYQGTQVYFSGANIFLKANRNGIRPIDDVNIMREILDLDCGAQAYVGDALKMAILNHKIEVVKFLISKYHASAEKALEISILNKHYDLAFELLTLYPASVNVTNIPDEFGVTLIHRLVRDGAFNVFKLVMRSIEEEDVFLNPNSYFTQETLRSCTVDSEISKIDTIKQEQLAKPFYVGQNNCNTILIWDDGSQMVFRNTDAGIVYDRLHARLQQLNSSLLQLADGHERLIIFGSPGHFFIGIDNEIVGFYPTGIPTSDLARATTSVSETTIPACIWADRLLAYHIGEVKDDHIYEKLYSDPHNEPKVVIHIPKRDARAVRRRINALKASCKIVKSKEECSYHAVWNNCIVKVKDLCGDIPCTRFLTDEQLATGGFSPANIAHVYERAYRMMESKPVQNTVTVVGTIGLALIIGKITKSTVSWVYSQFCRNTKQV